MRLMNAPGTRDYLPEDKITRQNILDLLRRIFELHGYNPVETPAIERFEVLASKYTGGSEILKETFKVLDQGKRDLGLRYDLTVPLARVVGQNPNLKMPFKRYHIDKVWRDGPISQARYREFWQADADIVGCRFMTADAEALMIASRVFSALDLECRIRVNNRKVLDGILNMHKIKDSLKQSCIISLDKLDKIGRKGVLEELADIGLLAEDAKKLLASFDIKDSPKILKSLPKNLVDQNEELTSGISELSKIADFCNLDNLIIDFSLARGLSYYTGTIFEVNLVKSNVKSSVAGGGRYDRMISSLLGSNIETPAVGISFGVDRIFDALKEKMDLKKSMTQVFVVHFKNPNAGFQICNQLRDKNITADMDLCNRGPSKNLQYADTLGIPFVIFAGEDEIKSGKIKLKNMISGSEKICSLTAAIKEMKTSLQDS